jgi:hypothetical protein
MESAADNKLRELSDRLLLLLIARPCEGWEREFTEITCRELARLAMPLGEQEQDV